MSKKFDETKKVLLNVAQLMHEIEHKTNPLIESMIEKSATIDEGEERKVREQVSKALVLKMLKEDFFAWCHFFLPHHFKSANPDFHYEIAECLFDTNRKRMALAASRGTAKSTLVSLSYPLFQILNENEPNIIVISINHESAKKLLNNIKQELTRNERIEYYYGNRKSEERWSDSEFVWGDTICTAFGLNMPIRVAKHGSFRPTLALIDDIETRDLFVQLKNKDQSEMLLYKDYIYREVHPALDPKLGKVRLVGTIFHPDAILPFMMKDKNYFSRKWSVFQEDEEGNPYSLWPEWLSVEMLLKEKESLIEQGQASVWYSEYLNEPVSLDTKMFGSVARYTDIELKRSMDQLIFFMGFDLATGKGHDKTSSVVIARDLEAFNNYFVVEVFNKRCEIDESVAEVLNQVRKWKPVRVVTQSDLMAITNEKYIRAEAIRLGVDLPLQIVKSQHQRGTQQGNSKRTKMSKEQRLTALTPLIKSGKLKVLESQTELIKQIENYPYVNYDDILDALLEAVNHSYPSDKLDAGLEGMEKMNYEQQAAFEALRDKLEAQRTQREESEMAMNGDLPEFGRWNKW